MKTAQTENPWDWRANLSAARLAMENDRLDRAEGYLNAAAQTVSRADDPLAWSAQEKAYEAFYRAAEVERTSGDLQGRAATLNNLAQMTARLGRKDEALEQLREAVSISAELGDQISLGTALTNLGVLLAEQGALSEALKTLSEALNILRPILSANDPRLIGLLSSIADVEVQLGDLNGAAELYSEAVEIAKASFGLGHPYLTALNRKLAATGS